MKVYKNPPEETWPSLVRRPQLELGLLDDSVRGILARVRNEGDEALREFTRQFDKAEAGDLQVASSEIAQAERALTPALTMAIRQAAENIRTFHAAQRRDTLIVETMPGVKCWRKPVPIGRVGIYIPGGSAPLFSTVLMLGIPAQLAGCAEIVLCTPPGKDATIHPAILFAAQLVGVTKVFKVGGAQAIAAMAYGTESIPNVYKIFGPGNQYVTRAKQLVAEEGVAIDMPAGPSEVLVMADKTCNPVFVAADLLSQAEHGADSQVMLVVTDDAPLEAITQEIQHQLEKLPRRQMAESSLASSRAVVFADTDTAIHFSNKYAPEHLIINTSDAAAVAERISNAGSVFIGNFSPEAVGDYASGTNHTLPTNGYAKAYAGVSLESFLKYITFQQVSEEGMRNVGPIVAEMARAEALTAHERAVLVRLQKSQR